MSGLREEFEGQVLLTVVSAEETKASAADLERYNLTTRGHGLVALDSSGDAVLSIAGHRFGEPEIRIAIAQATME